MFSVPSREASVLVPFVAGVGTALVPGSVGALVGAGQACAAADSLFLVY